MRHINLDGVSPPAELLTKARELTTELMTKTTREEQQEFIERNKEFWGDFKVWLSQQSNGKCWFSEAKDCFSYLHVDHFRPKAEAKSLDGEIEDANGYWWLAFDWQNYRLMGSAGNTPKSSKFPIRPGTHRATVGSNVLDEEQYLLDPTSPADPGLLNFDETGTISPLALEDGWDFDRASASIIILNLDFDALTKERKTIWDCCDRECNRARNAFESNLRYSSATDRANLASAIKSLKQMVHPDTILSSVAICCVRSQGVPWLERNVLG